MLCVLPSYAAIPKADASVSNFKSRFHLRDMSIAKACARGVLPVPATMGASSCRSRRENMMASCAFRTYCSALL